MFRKLLLAAVLATLPAYHATAATLAADFTSPTVDSTNGSWSLGFEFNVNIPFVVTELGFYDDFQNDLTQSHDVGIYNAGGTLLVSGTISPGDPLVSWFRWTSVTPTLLPVGNGYRIAGVTGAENYTWSPTGFTTDPSITFVADRYTSSATLVFPADGPVGVNGFFGPNFAGNPVPEPGTFALLAAGLIAGIGRVRHIRRSQS